MLQAPIDVEQMQVRHCLAHGEEELMRVELAAKQRIEHVRRGLGRLAGFMQLGKAQAVMLLELRDSLAQAPERQGVRGEGVRRRRQARAAPYRGREASGGGSPPA